MLGFEGSTSQPKIESRLVSINTGVVGIFYPPLPLKSHIFEQQELLKKAEVIRKNLTASTWHDLETNGGFDKNKKLSFISDDMLILGCDIGSKTRYMRAIDTRGRELSKSAFSFSNDSEGFRSAKEWAVKIVAEHSKGQIVLGLEPTGHYWFCLATWMVSNGISVVQVNPYAVKRTKEVEDNSQLKDDRKRTWCFFFYKHHTRL